VSAAAVVVAFRTIAASMTVDAMKILIGRRLPATMLAGRIYRMRTQFNFVGGSTS
jgi:hypothetical protein